ncbi:MAG: ABC transporter ATP-binding protein [Halanaerobiaceae bacterium]
MIIKVNDLSYSYSASSGKAVNGLTFSVQKGEVFGFLGPSGAGKTTTQRILIGLLSNYQGQVTVFGKNLSQWGQEYYTQIGVSFELPYHFNKLTARENLDYFAALYERKVRPSEELLNELGLLGSADQRVENFSKGMKNRLSLARALLHNPELLFLDEPTAGLDPVNARKVKDLIVGQKENGVTIFLTTHDMSAASELCDRVSFIVGGKIALIENPHKLEVKYGKSLVCVEYEENGQQDYQEFSLKGIGQNEDFINLLKEKDIRSIHTKDATLEDVFIKVTGRTL